MPVHILDAMAREGFEQVLALHDRRSGLRGFLGVHDTVRGPAFGGIRRWAYRDEREALLDCLRLARAMTHKSALLDLPAGGGKLVLLDRAEVDWPGAYRHVGEVIERMAGSYYTGPDVNTGPEELAAVASATSFVTDPGPDGPGELAESTAEGVFRGIAAALRARNEGGSEDWTEQTIVVQGLGAVGAGLAQRLVERGVNVLGADLDADRAERVASEHGFELVDPAAALAATCDVLAPCALGGLLHDLTVQRLRARIVCGAANNVLARPMVGDRLHERGILFVPDFVVNAGALIRGTVFHLEGRREPVPAIGARIERVVGEILHRARAESDSPARVAVREADERIARWRNGT